KYRKYFKLIIFIIFIITLIYIQFIGPILAKREIRKVITYAKTELLSNENSLNFKIQYAIYMENKFIKGKFFYLNNIIHNNIFYDKNKKRMLSVFLGKKNCVLYIGSIFFPNNKGSLENYIFKKY
ncbi:hypothetical protein J7L48_07010, partial [bacterium]|nr:hypothetical protein [bacterium]